MAVAMACPWIGPNTSVWRTSRSRVPCNSWMRSAILVDSLPVTPGACLPEDAGHKKSPGSSVDARGRTAEFRRSEVEAHADAGDPRVHDLQHLVEARRTGRPGVILLL